MSDNTRLTLSIDRIIDAPRDIVWRCWTENALIRQWHCPRPWQLTESDMEVRAGGRMNNVMEGPDGERFENTGSFLEVVPGERLVFTDAYSEGYQPRPDSFMTGVVEFFDAEDGRTRMIWSARHATAEKRDQHLEMGFESGWNAAADQLNELASRLKHGNGNGSVNGMQRKVRTCWWFDGNGYEAAKFYCSVIPGSHIDAEFEPRAGDEPMVVEFTLAGAPMMILNGGPMFQPNEAASISVLTEDQAETDRLWDALLDGGGSEGMCAWLKDRYGVSWQIVPRRLVELLNQSEGASAARVRDAMMQMRKIDIAAIEAASLDNSGEMK